MLKVYGSDLCPDCVACKTALDASGVAYDFVNVTENMKNLKEFLKKRDSDPVFDDARQKGYVGIPSLLLEDDSITLDWEAYLKENNLNSSINLKTGSSCRIDGTGC